MSPESHPVHAGNIAGARAMLLILVTGMSGSGKSVALNVLEDSGFYCVDNLPANLLAGLIDFLGQAGYAKVAVSVDVRSGPALKALAGSMAELRQREVDLRVLFLDAKTETLVKRFSETRRRHPLSDDTRTLPECIQAERSCCRTSAPPPITSTPVTCRPTRCAPGSRISSGLAVPGSPCCSSPSGSSTAYRWTPTWCSTCAACPIRTTTRCCGRLTGKDGKVIEFLQTDATSQKMLADISVFLDDWLPCYIRDNRSYLTVAIGCTGGRHRSVYFAETLARRFRATVPVLVRHRELAE